MLGFASIVIVIFYLILIVAFVAFVACLIEALFPKWIWKTFESWKAKEEPPKAYFIRNRISGIVGMIILAAIALAPTLIAYFVK